MLARVVLLLLIVAPAMALAADDPPPVEGPVMVAQPPKPAPAAAAATAPLPAIQSRAAAQPPADPAACRMSCAQTYYFCGADAQSGGCGDTWSQCVSTCNSPGLDPDATPTS